MPSTRPVLCEFCGAPAASAPTRARPRCDHCDLLARPLLVLENPRDDAREVMINQNEGEPPRKLLELRNHAVVVFFTRSFEIASVEIETKAGDRILRWHTADGVAEYLVRNIGKGYSNHDEMVPRCGFDREALRRDFTTSEANLRPQIRAVLRAALDA